MPGRTLPTFLSSEVESRNTKKSCYVTLGQKVYDVTEFMPDHPGGDDLILDYGGKDITEIMANTVSHEHSESAYEILDDYLIGFVAREKLVDAAVASNKPGSILPPPPNATGMDELRLRQAAAGITDKPLYSNTGMSNAEDLSRETDVDVDYKTYKFIDLNRPMFPQVWNGGFTKEFYLEQVHRPRHYKGGESAPLFGNFLEPLSKTPWWVVPTVWLPLVTYGVYTAYTQIPRPLEIAAYFTLGLGLWTIIEYGLHRCLFHLDYYLPDNRVGITLHFILHGIHHYLPMDKYRLVMPPTLFAALAVPFWPVAKAILYHDVYAALAGYCGGITGYVMYDLTHYFLHHRTLPSYYRELKKYHLQHHFADYENGFGVTSRFWDRVFGTELPPLNEAKAAKAA